MESGESIYEAGLREFKEETNLTATNPHLKGVFTMIIKDGESVVDEWMLYTFAASHVTGEPFKETREGILEWHPIEAIHQLPMAEGDRKNLLFAALEQGIQYGTFIYTTDYELLDARFQTSIEK